MFNLLTQTLPKGTLPRMIFIVENYYPMFIEGLKYTVIIALFGTLFGVLLGMFLVSLRIQKVTKRDNVISKVIKKIGIIVSTTYVDIIRGTPMMIQAFIIYYPLYAAFKINVILAGVIIVSLNTAAYAAEVLRGAVNAIDKGQMEAARSLGLSNKQAMINVIIPQALRNSIPAIGNELVINIKDSSVLSVIGVIELMYQSKAAASQYYIHVESALVAAVMYLFLTISTTRILEYIVNKMDTTKKVKLSIPSSQSMKAKERLGVYGNN